MALTLAPFWTRWQGANPGAVGLRGDATNTAVVTVNGQAVQSDDITSDTIPWHFALEADNGSGSDFPFAEIVAVINPPGTNTPDIVSTSSGHLHAPPQNETLTYDDDGNLTSDGRRQYTWDAENRLIAVVTRDDLPAAVPRVMVEYAYDHQSRRIASSSAVWINGSWQAVESRVFLYDGWNVVSEHIHTQTHTLTNSYLWGLDLSGSLQGAGGIGGLLAASLDGTTALYCHDANGNVGQLVSTDGDLLAHHEYSPFGETIVSTGPLAKSNPFRFSTKWFDNDTRLGYWGYRWYSPGMGRWLSRDPIGERGGLHLYAVCANDIINFFDPFGLWDLKGVLAILCCKTDATGQNAVKIMAQYKVYSIEPQTGKTQYYEDATKQKKVGAPVSWRMGGYHSRGQMEIAIDQTESNEEAAGTVIHETTHAQQHDRMAQNPNNPPMSRKDKEREARVATEQWRLDRGLPPEDPPFRIKDPKTGKETLDVNAIYKKVDPLYGISPGGQDLYGEDFDVNPASPKKTSVGPWKCP